jgi:hypothetical protein
MPPQDNPQPITPNEEPVTSNSFGAQANAPQQASPTIPIQAQTSTANTYTQTPAGIPDLQSNVQSQVMPSQETNEAYNNSNPGFGVQQTAQAQVPPPGVTPYQDEQANFAETVTTEVLPQPAVPTVDAQQLFQSSTPYATTPIEPESSPKKRHLLRPIVLTMLVISAVGVGIFGTTRVINGRQASPTAGSDVEQALVASDLALEATPGTTTDTLPASSSDGSSETAPASEQGAAQPSGSTPSGSTPTGQSNTTSQPQSVTKKNAVVSASIPTSVTCKKQVIFDLNMEAGALSQVEKSVNAALSGNAAELIKWVPAKYRNTSPESSSAAVNKSYKNLGPTSCTATLIMISTKTEYSGKSYTVEVYFPKNARNKIYAGSVNVSLVGNTWKTSDISTLNEQ